MMDFSSGDHFKISSDLSREQMFFPEQHSNSIFFCRRLKENRIQFSKCLPSVSSSNPSKTFASASVEIMCRMFPSDVLLVASFCSDIISVGDDWCCCCCGCCCCSTFTLLPLPTLISFAWTMTLLDETTISFIFNVAWLLCDTCWRWETRDEEMEAGVVSVKTICVDWFDDVSKLIGVRNDTDKLPLLLLLSTITSLFEMEQLLITEFPREFIIGLTWFMIFKLYLNVPKDSSKPTRRKLFNLKKK